jgi:environmental stress-induced protein Ves
MITRFDYATLPVSRWRNGGGETREIISYPPGEAQFAWRASIATISADGPFSPFPGIDRVITLLHGDSVRLRGDHGEHVLQPHQPWAFPGERAIDARIRGSCEDFNIMTRRDSWRSHVTVEQKTVSSENGVAWVLAGEWQTAAREKLAVNQGIYWMDENTQLAPQSLDARLLFVVLNRVL